MTTHARQCNEGFGFALVHDWRAKGRVWCGDKRAGNPAELGGAFSAASRPEREEDGEGLASKVPPLGPTRVSCYLTRQHRHSGDDNLCVAEGIRIDTQKLSKQLEEPHIFLFQPGAMSGTCKPGEEWDSSKFTMWHEGWFASYVQASSPLQCGTIIEETVIFVSRDNWKHLYWQTGAFFNIFVAYNILGISPDEARIVMLDYWPEGPFKDIMTRAFSPSTPLVTIEELGKEAGGSVCFRRAVFNLPEYAAAIVKGRPSGDDCANSELVRAYASFVATRLEAAPEYTDADNQRQVRVIFNSRRNYDGRTLLRQLGNEEELFRRFTSRHPAVNAERVDFAQLSFADQVATAAKADIMVGMHGSGLAHCMWMQEEGIVVEITEPQGNLKTFRNLCKWSGKTYFAMPFTSQGGGGPVEANPDAFLKLMDSAVLIASSYYNRLASGSQPF